MTPAQRIEEYFKRTTLTQTGPVFGVPLIQSLPIGETGRIQTMPLRADLSEVRQVSELVAAGYEVLLSHYREKCFEVAELKSKLARAAK